MNSKFKVRLGSNVLVFRIIWNDYAKQWSLNIYDSSDILLVSSMIFEIPLNPENNRFKVRLGSNVFVFRIIWNDYAKQWSLNIYDSSGILLASSLFLVAGQNIIEAFRHLNIPGQIIMQGDSTFTSIAKMYYVTVD